MKHYKEMAEMKLFQRKVAALKIYQEMAQI